MNSSEIFALALGLNEPWEITNVEIKTADNSLKELHLHIGFKTDGVFQDKDGDACPLYDTKDKEWRHMNFSKGAAATQITQASIDLSPAFISGITQHFPEAEITFDRFHVVKLLNEAMDTVRKQERKEHNELKGHKYTFLKNNLSDKKQAELSELITLYPTLGEAYRLKVLFNDLWDMPDKRSATEFIDQWFSEVEKSKIQPFMKFAKTVKSHLSGIINFVETRITNAILESINSKIQMVKRRARGYRNTDNFINMIYFLCGKLKFTHPLDMA